MVTFVFSAESLFSVRNHCYQCGIIVLIKGVLFLNDHVTQLMVWEVPSSLNILLRHEFVFVYCGLRKTILYQNIAKYSKI